MTTMEFQARVDAFWQGLVAVVTGENAFFSHYKCESCGQGAGDRYDISWFDMNDKDTQGTGEVCVDCAMYIANNELPTHLD